MTKGAPFVSYLMLGNDPRPRLYTMLVERAEKIDRIVIAWGEVRGPGALKYQASLTARDIIVGTDDHAADIRTMAQPPYRSSDARSGVRGPSSHRRKHNQ